MKTILITGTSSGIGLATTVELARRGERVFASMRDLSRADALKDALAEAGAEATLLQLDVADDDSVRRGIADVLMQTSAIDVLVNNAGVTVTGPLERMSENDIARIFDTNVFGPMRAIRAVLPGMRSARRGRIINVSSVAAHPRFGIRFWSVYGASKAALSALSLELVKEVAPFGVEMVLLEAGVSGRTPVWDGVHLSAKTFGDTGPGYELAGPIAAAQVEAATSGPDSLWKTASMIADACTAEAPGIRFPAALQAPLEAVDQISDDDFSRLARGDTDPALYEGRGGFWALQKTLLVR